MRRTNKKLINSKGRHLKALGQKENTKDAPPLSPHRCSEAKKPPVQPKHSQPPLMCPITTEPNGTRMTETLGFKIATNKAAPKELDIDKRLCLSMCRCSRGQGADSVKRLCRSGYIDGKVKVCVGGRPERRCCALAVVSRSINVHAGSKTPTVP